MDVTRDRWEFVERLPYPWLVTLAERLRSFSVPDLDGPTLAIYSDYGGNSRESRFKTVALLFVDMERVHLWNASRESVRKEFLPDGRRMEFKGLNDGCRRRALPWFLRAADQIHGFCVAIAIDKRIESVLITKEMLSELHRRGSLQGKWNFKSLESMFRVVHFVSMFLDVGIYSTSARRTRSRDNKDR
jgi:hypothetical protein